MMRTFFYFFLSLSFALSLSLMGHAEGLSYSGHGKFSTLAISMDDENSTASLFAQTRGNLEWDFHKNFSFNASFELGALYLSQPGNLMSLLQQNQGWKYRLVDIPELEWNKKQGRSLFLLLDLDRLNFKGSFSFVDITLGRQALSYGISNFITPVTIFSRNNKLAFDSEYSIGFDAIRTLFPLGETSELELTYIFADKDKIDQSPILGRIKFPLGPISSEITTIYFSKNVLLGLGQQFTLFDFEIFSELAYTLGHNSTSYFRGSFGAQYFFPHEVLVTAEYHYNGAGGKEKDPEYAYAFAEGGIYLRKSHYITLSGNKTFLDTHTMNLMAVINPEDISLQLTLALETMARDNLYFSASISHGFAPKNSELLVPNTINFSLKTYF